MLYIINMLINVKVPTIVGIGGGGGGGLPKIMERKSVSLAKDFDKY